MSATKGVCSVEECEKPVDAKKLCTGHYRRLKKHGDVHYGGTMKTRGRCLDFAQEAAASKTNDCIIWPYGLCCNGKYGQVQYQGKKTTAHRLVLELAVGPPPKPSYDAAHAPLVCHNTKCVNPRHLRWATQSENNADKIIDGTLSRGENVGIFVLTEEQVKEIYADSRSSAEIAKDYPCSRRNVSCIKSGETWAWLTQP